MKALRETYFVFVPNSSPVTSNKHQRVHCKRMESTMSLTKAKSNAWGRTKQKPWLWLCFKFKRKRGFEPCTLKPFKTHHHLCVKLHKPGHFLHGNGYEEKQRVSQWEKIIIPPTEVQSWDHIRGPRALTSFSMICLAEGRKEFFAFLIKGMLFTFPCE